MFSCHIHIRIKFAKQARIHTASISQAFKINDKTRFEGLEKSDALLADLYEHVFVLHMESTLAKELLDLA